MEGWEKDSGKKKQGDQKEAEYEKGAATATSRRSEVKVYTMKQKWWKKGGGLKAQNRIHVE